jgi:hypothetical protein
MKKREKNKHKTTKTTSMHSYRKELAHMETINMMAKYQLAFALLEASLGKILSSRKTYEKWCKLRSLLHWKKMVEIDVLKIKLKSAISLQNIKSSLKKCLGIYNLHGNRRKAIAFTNLRSVALISNIVEKEEKKYCHESNALLKEMNEKESTIQVATTKNQLLTKQVNDLNGNITKMEDDTRIVKEKVKNLSEAISKISTDDATSVLRRQLHLLENENMELKQKVDATEANIGVFIQEMTQSISENQDLDIEKISAPNKPKSTAKAKYYKN